MISVERLLVAESDGRRDRQTLVDEVVADRQRLPGGFQLTGLVHQVVEDAKPFANAALSQRFSPAEVEASIGGGSEGQCLRLVALEGLTATGNALHLPAKLR